MNYQSWTGLEDIRYGYGSMFAGFVDNAPSSVYLADKASVQVYMGVPLMRQSWWKGQHRVIFTMWETDTLPRAWVRYLTKYDQILVPCQHNLELFSQHHPNVSVVPLGVDTTFWTPPRKKPNSKFQFRAGGSLWRRKGLDVVVKAFKELQLPDAELRIKAAPHAHDVPDKTQSDTVFLDRKWMSLEDQREWFNQADCFIAASRGEGFGLMPLQAIALGVPTIVSLSTGQKEFAHLATSTVSCGKSPADFAGQWDEPNIEELKEAMLWHYNNHVEAQKKATASALKVDEFTWAKASQKLVDAVPVGTLLKTKTRVEEITQAEVVVLKDFKADIGTNTIKARKDDIITLTDGEYQVLRDSGHVRLV
jgi:glycosyltransferase involved in cell wall biosynthesis